MVKLSSLRCDPELSERGRWVDYEGGKLLVAKTNNTQYQKELLVLLQENPDANDSEEGFVLLVKTAMSRAILLGWEGFEDDNGEAIEYTPEAGLDVLTDAGHQDFYQAVISESQATDRYRVSAEGN